MSGVKCRNTNCVAKVLPERVYCSRCGGPQRAERERREEEARRIEDQAESFAEANERAVSVVASECHSVAAQAEMASEKAARTLLAPDLEAARKAAEAAQAAGQRARTAAREVYEAYGHVSDSADRAAKRCFKAAATARSASGRPDYGKTGGGLSRFLSREAAATKRKDRRANRAKRDAARRKRQEKLAEECRKRSNN